VIVIGLLSGTSVDGLDVAVADVALDGDVLTLRPLGALEHPWPVDVRARLLGVLPPAVTTAGEICALDTAVGQVSAQAALAATERFGPADLVASLGQTVFHDVVDGHARGTLQLGQPAWIVEATGLPVISDLRARDIAAGGEGAPLASTLDALWLDHAAALNLGGIANVTVVGDTVTAFDTGPANCLLDAAVLRISGGTRHCDVDGRFALAGTVDEGLLKRLLAEPYYALPAPKSTGRELFHRDYVRDYVGEVGLSDADLMATLTELTAVTVADALRPFDLVEVVASGGGVRNPALMAALRRRLGTTPLVASDDRGLPAGDKEAYLVALLSFLSWHQLPGVVAGATGSTPRVLGRISPGDRPMRLPEPSTTPRRLVIV